ncbi:putative 3-hydroxyisobutyryl-CoA hydrolase [Helianthus annuus]|nr:putative 3-hydroxyisobutyryl-CoA hydrolase [Helianthus annuus]KAJ0756233.1 putative 3-hydroxyisobutyryl-CoA hydrolase [Helianthus annuus]KAJ0925175.1 putative 3-hydroxyisobutyryl-CoA hydrolase [Helianthus annuus]KAJ0929755.1 putative 3-hydroxyisobutyryl-CoA hydrolase [Helianthus annuus]
MFRILQRNTTQVSLIAIHGRFRVVTDNTLFAMLETALGSFPDVGASYYLSRLPGFFGEYVGLTGARLDGAEMLACGLATHFVPLEVLTIKFATVCCRLKTINSCFSRRTVEEIISALEEGDKNMDNWISWTIQALKKASPTSLKISLHSVSTYHALDFIYI